MQHLVLKSWHEFESRLEKLKTKISCNGTQPKLLFRGQSDSSWRLDTTLERRGVREALLSDYYRLVLAVKPTIETFTDREWNTLSYPEALELCKQYDLGLRVKLPAYDYLIHMRHHGFPSPLLDWTHSPHVAGYFAFRSPIEPKDKAVSIYVFCEYPQGAKVGSSDQPEISCPGHHIRTHRRHFLQQAEYTICKIFRDQEWHLTHHQSVFDKNSQRQDWLWKFDIPFVERLSVLRKFEAFNLNAFSLFQSEEHLMETIAVRELELSPRLFGQG